MKPIQMRSIACLLAAGGCLAHGAALSAGELEPPGPPAPTMKSLDEVPPVWSQQLDSTDGDPQSGCDSSRFRCVMNGEAILDLETGLVWTRVVDPTERTWNHALDQCAAGVMVGGRLGWRLPKLEELLSLQDRTQPAPRLPPGHPFVGVTLALYWSSTTHWRWTTHALAGWFGGGVLVVAFHDKDEGSAGAWCVRGGTASDFTSQPNE